MNNVIRTTLQALAAVLGGAQSLHANGLDEAYAIPSEQAMKLALRTQQILAEETGIPYVADPLGGSYYIEALTKRFEMLSGKSLRRLIGWAELSMRSSEVTFNARAQDTSVNLMPITIELVKARASIGEIVSRLRTVFGVYDEEPVF